MTNQEELKKIKKKYGERFMHLCRELFPTILENEGELYKLLSSTFGKNCKTLYEDIVNAGLEGELKNLIYNKLYEKSNEETDKEEKTPYELLEEAGYVLTECKTEEEIQSFKKYYAENEELCTFRGGRLNKSVVFFAVRKDVEDIKREDFKEPRREDEYGTSVMGIQFNKSGICTVSIKNRYNHRVNNPDATYGNDLDKIVPGLTESFERLLAERGLELNSSNKEELNIPGYVKANDGKYYKYNMEINGIYYCPGNIIIENGGVKELGNSCILLDYFILAIEYKELFVYDSTLRDSFTDALEGIEKVEVQKNKEDGTRTITISLKGRKPVVIEIDSNNQIIGYTNNTLTEAGNKFLSNNIALSKLQMPALVKIGNNFLFKNQRLTELDLPAVTEVGENFLFSNGRLTKLRTPKLAKAGKSFLYNNNDLIELEMPELTEVGSFFLGDNYQLSKLQLPKLKKAGMGFLYSNLGLTELKMPQLEKVGENSLVQNTILSRLLMPALVEVGDNFLYNNKGLTELEMPELIEAGHSFFMYNRKLSKLQLPKLNKAGYGFLAYNEGLTEAAFPKLIEVGDDCMYRNKKLRKLKAPLLSKIGNDFLRDNKGLTELEMPYNPEISERLLAKGEEEHNLESTMQEVITPKDIAELDKNSKLTETEISFGKRIINKLKGLFRINDSQR